MKYLNFAIICISDSLSKREGGRQRQRQRQRRRINTVIPRILKIKKIRDNQFNP